MVESSNQNQLTDELIQSICGPLASKVKLLFQAPQKNRLVAAHEDLQSLIDLLAEQLLPQYCIKNQNNYAVINEMHNLCYLLASKLQSVLNSGIIRTCIDQNWDLKGLRAVLLRILNRLDITDTDLLTQLLDKVVQSQNLQSQACIKAISYFLKSANKPIEEDDLRNPINSYQAGFQFLKKDITQFRGQKMKYECFTVLHPWAYDLDNVDFKYVVNKDHVKEISKYLNDTDATVFWLTFFKSQLSCTADEFFNAIRELSHLNLLPDYFEENYNQFKQDIITFEGVLSLKKHSDYIKGAIHAVAKAAQQKGVSFSALVDQVRFKPEGRHPTKLISEEKIRNFEVLDQVSFKYFQGRQNLAKMRIYQTSIVPEQATFDKWNFEIRPTQAVPNKLSLKFVNVDTDELKDTEINFDGNLAFFKVGEGDNNHFQIANDKKLWESQFMIICQNGKFYIRDLGVVHTSRIKVEKNIEIQLQQGTMIDLGKVVHYHFDKVTHKSRPIATSNDNFIIMRPNQDYLVESDDDSVLRGRQNWVSGDENKEMAQNEILISADDHKKQFSVGRSIRRDVEIKLKAVSADHCTIQYSNDKGWIIHENGKEKLSSNGTFVFMKSMAQMDNHEPSDMIPLTNGMIISFINYELQVKIVPKEPNEPQLFEEIQVVKHQQKQVDKLDVHANASANLANQKPVESLKQHADGAAHFEVSGNSNVTKSELQPQVQSHRDQNQEEEEKQEEKPLKDAGQKSQAEFEAHHQEDAVHEHQPKEAHEEKVVAEDSHDLGEDHEQVELEKKRKVEEEQQKRDQEEQRLKAELLKKQQDEDEQRQKAEEQKYKEEEAQRKRDEEEHQKKEAQRIKQAEDERQRKIQAEEEQKRQHEEDEKIRKAEEVQRNQEANQEHLLEKGQPSFQEDHSHSQPEKVVSHDNIASAASLHLQEEKPHSQEDQHQHNQVSHEPVHEQASEHKQAEAHSDASALASSASLKHVGAHEEEAQPDKNIVHNESAKQLEKPFEEHKVQHAVEEAASLNQSPSKAQIKQAEVHSPSNEHDYEVVQQQPLVSHIEESKAEVHSEHEVHPEQVAHIEPHTVQSTYIDTKEEHKAEASPQKQQPEAQPHTQSHAEVSQTHQQSSVPDVHEAEVVPAALNVELEHKANVEADKAHEPQPAKDEPANE